jgi:hypothetical protein
LSSMRAPAAQDWAGTATEPTRQKTARARMKMRMFPLRIERILCLKLSYDNQAGAERREPGLQEEIALAVGIDDPAGGLNGGNGWNSARRQERQRNHRKSKQFQDPRLHPSKQYRKPHDTP